MMIGAVDQNDVGVGATQGPSGGEASSGTDNRDAAFLIAV